MKILLAAAVLTLCASAVAIAADATIKPFHAQYATSRNGNDLGRTTLDLADNKDGTWTLRSETRGTSGLAKLAGVHVVETSRFRWKDGQPEGLVYDFRQDAAFRSKTRHADFDWKTGNVHVTEGGDDFRYAITPGVIDRQIVALAIASDLMHGASAFDYKVAVKDRVDVIHYTRGATQTLSVPAGDFQTILLMQRKGEPGAERKRSVRNWLAPSLGWLPVQIEQTETNGDTVTLKLLSASGKQAGGNG